jgi:hypothetical protein
MNWELASNISTTLAVIITISSILIIYFGKIIIRSLGKKDDLLEEGLSGFWFLTMYLIIPSLVIFIATNLIKYSLQWKLNLLYVILICTQFIIFLIYTPKRNKTKKGYWKFTISGLILNTISLLICYYLRKDFFFFTISILFEFLILTFIAIKEVNYLK